MAKRLLVASSMGFCGGVERAVKILEDALRTEGGTVYVRKEIVHNTAVIKRFKKMGAVFVNDLSEVPDGGTVVFAAHGVSRAVREEAKKKRLKVIDATCPLVEKVHSEAAGLKARGFNIILIGDERHDEIIGIMGEAPDKIRVIENSEKAADALAEIAPPIAWLSQTTLNIEITMKTVERLRVKFPGITDPPRSDICYATRDRQAAVKKIAGECDLFVVAGSSTSANTNRLVDIALSSGARAAVRIDTPKELSGVDFSAVDTVGFSAGVSAAGEEIRSIIGHLEALGYVPEGQWGKG